MTNHDATKFDQAFLVNKFYERYPLSEFKNDSERAEALGYFMAGAELQRLGKLSNTMMRMIAMITKHKRRRYTTGAKIFLAVYALALVAAIAGVVHCV